MNAWIALWAIATMALIILSLGWVVLSRLRGYGRGARKIENSSRDFSPARYEPLTRLLANQEDAEFLRRQTTCPRMLAKWERARVRIIRLYLNDLAADFRSLHATARALVAESPEQCSDLVGVLMRQQVTFWRAMFVTELRLTLAWMGFKPVDLRRLVETVKWIQIEIARSAPPLRASAGFPSSL